MKKFIAAFAFLPVFLSAQTVKNILFLGNSYTYVNNLPDMLAQLAHASGDSISWDANTPGGYTLQLHTQDANTLSKINLRAWDYVIIQAQSQEPSVDTAYVEANVFPYAHMLDSLVHVNDSCTQTVFYMTWGRKNGDASNCAAYPPVCTYSGMQQQLTGRYLQMAYDNHAMTAPVGCSWRNCIATNPPFDLYMSDESHPSVYGSYLAACTFYASIFRQSPAGLNYYGGLTQNEAQFLQNIAAATVLDSMNVWNTEIYYPVAAFNGTITGVNTATCVSASTGATSWSWNDGSGNGFVPGNATQTFVFTNAPSYTICLAVSNGCRTDTICEVIQQTGMNENAQNNFSVYPVPAEEYFFVENSGVHLPFIIRLYNSTGQLVYEKKSAGEKTAVSTSGFAPGLYLLKIETKDHTSSSLIPVSGQ